jgi:hypothetical protein
MSRKGHQFMGPDPSYVAGTLEAVEAALLRHGVQVFCDPTPGCRLVSRK